jgi:hypothetical protein
MLLEASIPTMWAGQINNVGLSRILEFGGGREIQIDLMAGTGSLYYMTTSPAIDEHRQVQRKTPFAIFTAAFGFIRNTLG